MPGGWQGKLDPVSHTAVSFEHLLLTFWSILLGLQALFSIRLALYAWEDERTLSRTRAPESFDPPTLSFTVLLPARHEESVIGETIRHIAGINYPRELVQVLVIVAADDVGTIAAVEEEICRLGSRGVHNVRLVTFGDGPINKPHALNVGLKNAVGDVVCIFDAEDEPHPDIFNIVNTVMLRERVHVVQCGVQLMNYADRWFSALNVLEYFFWFKSRLHYHARVGAIPLGGNTVFVKRQLLEAVGGWDEGCLTEDADLGIRLSAAGVPIRVVYEDRYVTREETPPTVGQFIRQRTRWNQGFLQVLLKGDWMRLAGLTRKVLAAYTLAFPLFQAMLLIYLPVSLWLMLFVKMPDAIALISILPFYLLLFHLVVHVVGLYEFGAAHGLRPSLRVALGMALTYLPYQWLLSYAAFRAVWRLLWGFNNWEKTAHVGAHRRVPIAGGVVTGD